MSRDNRRIPCTACGRSKEVRDMVDARTYVCAACGPGRAPVIDNPVWRERAACATNDNLALFDAAGEGDYTAIYDAKQVCMSCDAFADCYVSAMATETGSDRNRWGIRAATTPADRARIQRARREAGVA